MQANLSCLLLDFDMAALLDETNVGVDTYNKQNMHFVIYGIKILSIHSHVGALFGYTFNRTFELLQTETRLCLHLVFA